MSGHFVNIGPLTAEGITELWSQHCALNESDEMGPWTRFMPFEGPMAHQALEIRAMTLITRDGYIDYLHVYCPNAPIQPLTVTLRVNGVNTALQCIVTGAGVFAGSDLVNQVQVQAGDLVNWCVDYSTGGGILGRYKISADMHAEV